MINETILILKLSISHLMMMFLALHPMEFIFLNSSDFARASSHVADVKTYNLLLIQKLLKQYYQCHKL